MQIYHDEKNQRFYTEISDEIAELKYKRINKNTLDYYSTFVPESLRNQGIAEKLVKTALDFAASNKHSIIPSCSYVAKYISTHPEYAKVVQLPK